MHTRGNPELAAMQAAHSAVVMLLAWLHGTDAMGRPLLEHALRVLGAAAGCAADAGAADRLAGLLARVRGRLAPSTARDLAPAFTAALVRRPLSALPGCTVSRAPVCSQEEAAGRE